MSALRLINVSKKYTSDFLALNSINLNLSEGDFLSILGKNGAGKSTIIGIITSLIKKTSGKVYVFNYDLDYDYFFIRSLIGIVPQEFNFNQFESVSDIIFNQAGFYGLSRSSVFNRVKFLLDFFGLWGKRDVISMNLSGGMKRRLMLIRAMIHNPDILILDEPTAGVDIFSRKIILDFLKDLNKLGKTIILTTHYLEEVETLCNKVIVLDKGKLLNSEFVKNLKIKNAEKIYILTVDKLNFFCLNKDFIYKVIDDHSIEILISNKVSLNDYLNFFLKNNVHILNIESKTNVIENFFFDSIK